MFGKCKKSSLNKASARVIDGKLILSLPEATTPVVWQMDLSHAKASALEVRQSENLFTLTLKTPKGETIEIATFDDRALSVDGLMAASRALENAHGHIRPSGAAANDVPVTAYASDKPVRKSGKFMPVFLTVVVLFVLYVIWSSLMPLPAADAGRAPTASSSQGASGVPLSADEYLKR